MSLLLRRYTSTYRRHPYSASFVTCCLKGALADIVAQTAQLEGSSRDPPAEGSSQQVAAAAGPAEYSPRRTALFALWSGAYCGSAQHYIFNVLFSRVFGAGTSVGVALSKACADSFVATPLLGIPIYYACKPLIEGGGGSPLDGLQEYGSIFREFYFKPAMGRWLSRSHWTSSSSSFTAHNSSQRVLLNAFPRWPTALVA
eukprot:COSAG01_NODE_883_length_12927_cov_10.710789_4_plen_200_part_00